MIQFLLGMKNYERFTLLFYDLEFRFFIQTMKSDYFCDIIL